MEFNSVGEIFTVLDKVREKLRSVAALTDDQANSRANGEGWSVAEIVEHIGIVADSMVRITNKLLTRAETDNAGEWDGKFNPPLSFAEQINLLKDSRLQAPKMVHPQGTQSIAESLARLDEVRYALDELRPRLESINASAAKFPHPFLGELNLYQWLIVLGLHERRHLQQIERILTQKSSV